MTEERDGFTIQVHGDVPQEALDGLVAAIPVRTVIIGAGPNVHAMPAPTAEDVSQMFGAGSEAATMAHAALKHKPYETWQEREARRDQESFDKATKIDAEDYTGWVSWPGRGDDGFFESVDELRAHCTIHKLALPPFVWACTREPFKLDADHILDQALEEHHDGARGEVSTAEEERLQKFLDEWCAVQEIVSWHEDRTRAVMLVPEEPDAKPTLAVGARVTATCQITEAGGDVVGDPAAVFPAADYIHAETGDIGTIEHVDGDGAPTVRFDRTRTSTIVAHREIAVVPDIVKNPSNPATMSATICGFDRKALMSALEWQAQEWVEDFMIHDMARLSDEPIKSCFAAIMDPEKLAAIIAELLRGFGFADLSDMEFAPSHEARVKAQDDQIKVYQRLKGAHKLGGPLFTMPPARDLALRLLQLPKGTTVEDVSREVEAT